MTAPLLEVRDLAKAFGGVAAVDGVSFRLDAGAVTAVIGPNGAGKTTLLNLIAGGLAPDRGRIRLGRVDLAGRSARAVWRAGVGRTFQIPTPLASMTVREAVQLVFAARTLGYWRFWQPLAAIGHPETDPLLGRFGLDRLAGARCGDLPYGTLKRLDLALAMAARPSLLLLDEPTAGLGDDARGPLLALALARARADGTAVLFVEHDVDLVFGHAERVLVLDQGRVIAAGPPHQVRADARVRAAYLGDQAAPALGGDHDGS